MVNFDAKISMLPCVSYAYEAMKVQNLLHDHWKDTLQRVDKPINLASGSRSTLGSDLKGIGHRSRNTNESQSCKSDLGASHKVAEDGRLYGDFH